MAGLRTEILSDFTKCYTGSDQKPHIPYVEPGLSPVKPKDEDG